MKKEDRRVMKVEFKVGEIEVVATTDVVMPRGVSCEVEAGIRAGMFSRLISEAKVIAFKFIEAKYKKENEVAK